MPAAIPTMGSGVSRKGWPVPTRMGYAAAPPCRVWTRWYPAALNPGVENDA
jgi:hypothetical protein